MALPDGLYDLLLTESLASRLDLSRADVLALKDGAAEVLADALTRQLAAILGDLAGDDAGRPQRQLELVNTLLVALRQRLAADDRPAASAQVVDLVAPPLRVLKALHGDRQFPLSPEIGLAVGESGPTAAAVAPAPAPGLDGASPPVVGAAPAAVAGDWESGLQAEAMTLLLSGRMDVWDELTRRFERKLILTALDTTRGRRIEAAHKLGIGRNTITRKIQELGIEGGEEDK